MAWQVRQVVLFVCCFVEVSFYASFVQHNAIRIICADIWFSNYLYLLYLYIFVLLWNCLSLSGKKCMTYSRYPLNILYVYELLYYMPHLIERCLYCIHILVYSLIIFYLLFIPFSSFVWGIVSILQYR